MGKAMGAAAAMVGTLFLLLGLLFLVGAGGQVRRMVIGGVGLAVGVVVIAAGVRLYRTAEARSPERLRAVILELAKREDGEVSDAEIAAALAPHAAAGLPVVGRMVAEGLCRRARIGGDEYLVFPSLQPRLLGRYCQYCDTELSLAAEVSSCPKCGGALEKRIVRRALGGDDYFAMDG
jgi:hypothetical protein